MSKPSLIQYGGLPFLITSILGRIPPAMIQLGLLMYVSGVGLGHGLGGLTVAAVGLGTAAGATIMGRLIDTFGPLPIVVGTSLAQLAALLLIHLITPVLVDGRLSTIALLLIAGIAGFANPQIGSIVRSHWSHLSRRRGAPALVRQALGYESAVDEMSYIVGPVIAGLIVGLIGPTPAIFTLMAAIFVGQGAFALYLWADRTNWADNIRAQTATGAAEALSIRPLIAPMLVLLAVGITFGATQTALNAANEARGTPGITGIVYGSVGIGSAITSLLTPRLSERVGPALRLATGALGLLAAAVLFMAFSNSGLWLVAVAVPLGLAIGVVLVTGFARAEAVAPSSRIASTMTLMSMFLTLGVSAGAAIAGQLAGVPWRAFLPVTAAGLMVGLASALVSFAQIRSRRCSRGS